MKIAIVRVRGSINVRGDINETMDLLHLKDKNHCTVVETSPQILGMIHKIKNFVTYGEISEEVYNDLIAKRGREYTGRLKDSKGKIDYSRRYFELNGKKYLKYFRLAPPIKGYNGVKKPFVRGGALGDRKEKINELLKRMI